MARSGWCAKTPSERRHPTTSWPAGACALGAHFMSNRTPSSRHASLQPPTRAPRRIGPGAAQSGGAPALFVCGAVLFSLIGRAPPEMTSPNARANTRVNAVLDTVERDVPSPSLLPLEPLHLPPQCQPECSPRRRRPIRPPEAPPGSPPRPLRLIMRSLPLSLTVVRASHHRLSSEMLGLAHIGLWAQWVPYR